MIFFWGVIEIKCAKQKIFLSSCHFVQKIDTAWGEGKSDRITGSQDIKGDLTQE